MIKLLSTILFSISVPSTVVLGGETSPADCYKQFVTNDLNEIMAMSCDPEQPMSTTEFREFKEWVESLRQETIDNCKGNEEDQENFSRVIQNKLDSCLSSIQES